MGFKQIDPAVKTRAVKAMRKAVERDGLSAYAAAHKLAGRYEISAGSLQRFYADVRAASPALAADGEPAESSAAVSKKTAAETVASEIAKKAKKKKSAESKPRAEAVEQPRTAEVAPTESRVEITPTTASAASDTPVSGALSGEFTRALETLSQDYVARLQQAALDDLIHKMQLLRDSLRQ
jgi:cell pole-organizing protein PopZ